MRRLLGDARDDRRQGSRRGTPADLLVVGLGNPGAEFEGSRHNAGSDVVALLADRHGSRLKEARHQRASIAEVRIGDARVGLAVPTSYMNESGQAVLPLIRRFGISEYGRLVVVHDELDLPPGRLQLRRGGGTAGHNGLKSVQAHLGAREFVRVRIGIGKPPGRQEGADFVLQRLTGRAREALAVDVARAADAVEILASEGLDAAMNRFNQ